MTSRLFPIREATRRTIDRICARCNLLFGVGLLALIGVLCGGVSGAFAQPPRADDDPPCGEPVRWLWRPQTMCAEVIFEVSPSPGQMAIGAITFNDEGALVFTRPDTRQIMRLPLDSRGVPGTPEVIAQGLPEAPLGITFEPTAGVLYISADSLIMKLDPVGTVTVLVRDLPGGAGRWLSNIRVGPDGRLYVVKGSGCDSCAEDDPRRAALLSFAPDGSDPQIVGQGLRDSFDLGWFEGALYVVDHERPEYPAELNRLEGPGSDFGFPGCAGDKQPTLPGVTCDHTSAPVVPFPPDSHPTGMVYYDHDLYPQLKGKLLVALGGSWNGLEVTGYEISAVDLRQAKVERFLPVINRSSSDASLIRASFYPAHLLGLAVDGRGWIYASTAEGRIYRFRPFPGR